MCLSSSGGADRLGWRTAASVPGGEGPVSLTRAQSWEALFQDAFADLTALQRFLHGHLMRTPAGQQVWPELPVIPESLASLAADAATTLDEANLLGDALAEALVAVRPRMAPSLLSALGGDLQEVEVARLTAVASDRQAELDQLERPDPRWLELIKGALRAVAERMQSDAFAHRLRKTTQVQDADLQRRAQKYFSERLLRVAPTLFAETGQEGTPFARFYDEWLVGLGPDALSPRLSRAITRWIVEHMAVADQLRALETASGLASGSWSVGGLEREISAFVREMVEPRLRPIALEIRGAASVARIAQLEAEVREARAEAAEHQAQSRVLTESLHAEQSARALQAERLDALEQGAGGARSAVPFAVMGVAVLVVCAVLYAAVSAEIALNQQELEALHQALPAAAAAAPSP